MLPVFSVFASSIVVQPNTAEAACSLHKQFELGCYIYALFSRFAFTDVVIREAGELDEILWPGNKGAGFECVQVINCHKVLIVCRLAGS